MGSGALAENHPLPLAFDAWTDPDMGKLEETRDDRAIGLCDVPYGRRNHRTPPPRL